MTRDEAYNALAAHLGVPAEQAHMHRMPVDTCKQVVDWARPQVDRDWDMHPWKREASATGDCFEAAGQAVSLPFTKSLPDGAELCHGVIVGHGPDHVHAWCEAGGMVYDFSQGKNLMIPREVYYQMGGIDPSRIKRYNRSEVLNMTIEHQHWGPWEDLGCAL